MKKILPALLLLLMAGLLAGCTIGINDDLPEQPVEFVMGNYVNPNDKEDSYGSVEYKGRIYVPCGTLRGTLRGKDVGACLGYLVRESDGKDEKVEDIRFFLLTGDSAEDLLVCLDKRRFMDQPVFFRAVDTAGKKIDYPKYIKPSDDLIW